MRPPLGKASNVEVVEVAPHEFLLEPHHEFKEIRGTKYFESGSETLLELTQYIIDHYSEMASRETWSRDPGPLFLTGMFTGVKYNSNDILAFIRQKSNNWKKNKKYRMSTMPPKLIPTHHPKQDPTLRHNLKLSENPSVIYAFVGVNTQPSRIALARGLVAYKLMEFSEISSDGKTVGWKP